MLDALLAALSLENLLLALLGVIGGTVIGALPGLSATMAVAVLVPFTFTMEPSSGLLCWVRSIPERSMAVPILQFW